ncbi:MAG: DUF4465 domain-containing protein [Planctomycetaceae bacterium]|nr:DUF4465 domain-containing protein [Planctomycetaceae bacterium]
MKRSIGFLFAILMIGAVQGMVADFDDLTLNANSHWSGDYPSDGIGGTMGLEVFQSGSAGFENHSDGDWGMWGGFAFSNETDNQTAGFMNQFSTYAGRAHSGANFGVGYVDAFSGITPTIVFDRATTIAGVYVTNTTYAAMDMLYGNPGFSKKFGGPGGSDKDWLRLSIIGKTAAGQSTGPVEFYLADYRFDDNGLDYIVNDWQYVDLRSLGQVDSLVFSLSSSDNSGYGMNTPAYFAIDTIVPEPAVTGLLLLGGILARSIRKAKPSA